MKPTVLSAAVSAVALLALISRLDAETFTVIYPDDHGPGTLRQAITDANTHPNSGLPDVIAFMMTEDPGVQMIKPSSPLPAITDPVVIDGYTQPGTRANSKDNNALLLIQVVGEIKCTASATIRGLIINQSLRNGIYLVNSSGHVITGNRVENNAGSGIELANASATIGGTEPSARNFISTLTFGGAGTIGSTVQGNTIGGLAIHGAAGITIGGPSPDAANDRGNGSGFAVTIGSGSSVDGTVFAGSSATSNVIEGNILSTVSIKDGAHSNFVLRNRIGFLGAPSLDVAIALDGAGTSKNTIQGNAIAGSLFTDCVIVRGSGNNLIGGANAGEGNTINGGYVALSIESNGNIVQGNQIGTDSTGTKNVWSTWYLQGALPGLRLAGSDNVVGGTVAGAGNVISTNRGDGILITGSGNRILGNFIGTDRTRTLSLPNARDGIRCSGGTGNIVGGEETGAGNTIAFNNGNGVTGAVVTRGNFIFGNLRLGIDPGGDGATPNSVNGGLNFPVITASAIQGDNAVIQGTLNAAQNTRYLVDLYSDSQDLVAIIPQFLGSVPVITDTAGNGSFSETFPVSNSNVFFVATATDANKGTSEFSDRQARLLNISTRLAVAPGENALIAGFIFLGRGTTNFVVRGLGPSLVGNGVPPSETLADPTLELFGSPAGFSDNWKDDPVQRSAVRESGLAPTNDLEAAYAVASVDQQFYGGITPGGTSSFTTVVRGKNETSGIGLVEVYAPSAGTIRKLANISSRGFVGTGNDVMIAGFILGDGNEPTRIVLRAIGPELLQRGIANALSDPVLELHNGSGTTIAVNDNWKDDQKSVLEATGIPPTDDAESAILTRLGPGNYTAVVRGAGGKVGVALVEVYNLP